MITSCLSAPTPLQKCNSLGAQDSIPKANYAVILLTFLRPADNKMGLNNASICSRHRCNCMVAMVASVHQAAVWFSFKLFVLLWCILMHKIHSTGIPKVWGARKWKMISYLHLSIYIHIYTYIYIYIYIYITYADRLCALQKAGHSSTFSET